MKATKITVNAIDNELRFLIFSGQPLKEPVAWGGPIVMNTTEELNQAFADIDNDKFVKKPEKKNINRNNRRRVTL